MTEASVSYGCWRASAWLEGDLVHGCFELVTPWGPMPRIEPPAPAHRDSLAELQALASAISGGFLHTWRLVAHVACRGRWAA